MEEEKTGRKEPKGFQRRDLLIQLQTAAQRKWNDSKVFEVDAPEEGDEDAVDLGKYFGNFPFPYMNGLLHIGHAFTLSKIDFATAYYRLKGRRSLFPFGFHCTGMPIRASADKLKREMELYGCPPTFPDDEEEKPAAEEAKPDADPTKFKAKKSKAKAKSGKKTYQWQIMEMSGIPQDEIAKFEDPLHWLRYFPPFAVEHLKMMGCGIDWRRSFITTDVNPYFDSFVQWHLNTLRKRGRVVKDTRFSVYSPMDGQPCMDHDRQSGEGVIPQEYTVIKMKVQDAGFEGALAPLKGKNVYLAAATLRPETMYGQTNCWVLPSATYGCFEFCNGDVMVMLERAARNASYQGLMAEEGKLINLFNISGEDLIGCPLSAPLSSYETIYALPLMTILTNKGTGVVTSVPSDAPDDYMGLQDLKRKPDMRTKFGIKDEWIMPFEVIPIMNIPDFGDTAAVKVCTDLKINSQNDKRQLEEAKRLTYLRGFTDGVMLVGEYAGRKVQEAKPLLKQKLISTGEACVYCEPEKEVISRSGDECVVALTDQWYITYGDDDWLASAKECLDSMNCYFDECKRGFEATLDWLRQWACSRSYGLGTKLPWDPVYLIESLSDSTIYMAYYTVAHFLQHGDMYGESEAPLIPASAMSDAVWDYILLEGPVPEGCPISPGLLQRMRQEFNFWYPFDVRASGKDLIQNHLTFSIYNHTAIWDKDPSKWPQSFRCNGHLLVNGEKMSKSLGNFKTLKQAIEEYSSDAMRLAFADAGDGLDDANFVDDTANAAILRLTKELDWFDKIFEMGGSMRSGEYNYADRAFDNEINGGVARTEEHYENLAFREALREAWFELTRARDMYRLVCEGDQGMHASVARKFIETLCLVMTPICPHWSDHIWSNVLKKEGIVLTAGWPSVPAFDKGLHMSYSHIHELISSIRLQKIKLETPKKNKPVTTKVVGVNVFVSPRYTGGYELVLDTLSATFDEATGTLPDGGDKLVLAAVRESPLGKSPSFKKEIKNILSFTRKVIEDVKTKGMAAFAKTLPFDELQLLVDNKDFILRSLELKDANFSLAGNEEGSAIPLSPHFEFVQVPLAPPSEQ